MTRLVTRFLLPYRRELVLVVALLTVQAIANLYQPNLYADIIDNGVAVGNTNYIMHTGALMLGVTLLLVVASVIATFFASRTAMAFGRDVRGAVFRKVLSFSAVETNTFGTPSLITRNTNDVQQVQMVIVMALTVMILAPIMAVGGVIMALHEDVPLSSILVIIVPLMALVLGGLVSRALPLFRVMQIKIDRINRVMREYLDGVRVIRAFVRTDHEEQRFDDANRDLTDTAIRVNRLFALMIPSLFGIMNLSSVAIMWFGGLRINNGQMPIGNLMAFLQYVMQILFSVMMATVMFVLVPRAAASAERIAQVIDTDVSLHDPPEPTPMPAALGVVEYRNVGFRYPGAEDPVLRDIAFSARPGTTTALIDGVDVRDIRQEELWSLIGLVPQRAFLFSGTVASNLRYGNGEATDEELWRALTIAQARDFVTEMPGQLEAPIDQGGTNVSGGQRQRLAIARAIVKHPRIYVFDESFSALDFKTDLNLRMALQPETRGATVFIVSQRVGTIMHADQIVVLDSGAIAGIGTHEELMETCETYREIVYSQLTREEVA
jgi:ATP-binding cassette subfamily B protein